MISVSKWKSLVLSSNGIRRSAATEVGAVAGVELATGACPSSRFWNRGQDAVADALVERHAARARRAAVHHARAEHGVGLAVAQRRASSRGMHSGAYCPSPCSERHEVEAVLDARSGSRSSGCRRSPG